MRYYLLLIFFLASCSYSVGNEYTYKGIDEIPYVKVEKFDRALKKCSDIGCNLYLYTLVSMHNPTVKFLKSEVKCVYYWGEYEHGSDTVDYFSLAPKKSRNISLYYTMHVPYNVTSKIGVSCDANYIINNDGFNMISVRGGFDRSSIKFVRTKKNVVWKTISIPPK